MQQSVVPLPRFVQIEPVGQCNLRCQMCPIQFRTDGPPDICRSCAVYSRTL
jgi:MoaA/NifB/PqqE/SkfB family radical SAM enzyme